MKSLLLAGLAALASVSFGTLLADTLETTDGSLLKGKLVRIEGGVVEFETAYAGVIKVQQTAVRSLATDDARFFQMSDGNTVLGRASSSGTTVQVTTPSGTFTTTASNISGSWSQGEDSPEVKARKAAEAAAQRRWQYEANVDVSGKSGNSDTLNVGVGFTATLASPHDALKFYANYNYGEKDSITSSDDVRGGVDYSNKFYSNLSWYVRAELGRDAIKDLDLWATTAGGLGYGFIDTPKQKLTGRVGVTYRYEDYGSIDSVSSPGLEAALAHSYEFSWGRLLNSVTYLPVFEDFGNFRAFHESSLELPIGAGNFWKLRLGVSNDYNSEPPPGVDELDTTYFTRLLLQWR